MKRICIIGGGAAGCMVATTIIQGLENINYSLTLLEKNKELGKKVRISGGGRCNVTTGIIEKDTILSKYTRGANILKYGIGKFGPKKTQEWFISQGVPLKCESDNRVFPVSDSSNDVMSIFEKSYKKCPNINLLLGTSVISVEEGENEYRIQTTTGEIFADYLVITTGGNAYRKTGSTGDGYKFGETLGHSLTPLGPSLSSLVTKEEWIHELSGIVLDKAQFRHSSGNKLFTSGGAVLFTHFGISGPGTFALSSELAYEIIQKESPLELRIVPLASWTFESWEKYLQQEFLVGSTKNVKTVIKQLLPIRFIEKISKEFKLEEIMQLKTSTVSKLQRQQISHLFGDGIPFTCTERKPGDEFVTAGGISTDEVNKETFESRLRKKLFFAGEILNIDGLTGGFNLQCAWTTGHLVGEEIIKQIKNS